MSLPEIATREEWPAARKDLLAREKELTRRRDELSAARRRLPMVEVKKHYAFAGPDGEARLPDLFEGRRQLIIGTSCSTRTGRTAARAAAPASTRSPVA